MKQAEFLNLDTKQIQWLDASLEHPNLVKIPNDAEAITLLEDRYINFYKGGASFAIDLGERDWDYGAKASVEDYLATYPDAKIIWQRNPLQEKINETLSALNVNKAQLSVLLGREKSYVKRLLAKGRNVTENTKLAVIDQLEQLIRAHEYEQPKPAQIDYEAIIAKLNLQLFNTAKLNLQLFNTSKLLDQAVADKNVWRLKLQDQRNLSWFLFWLFASAGCAFFILLWGTL